MQNCNTSLISIDFWFSVVVVVDCMRRIWPFWLLGVCIGSILKSSLLLLDCNLSRCSIVCGDGGSHQWQRLQGFQG